jgi:uncharacterized protein (DUF433 family)
MTLDGVSDRPRVEVDPGVHFGLPHVRGGSGGGGGGSCGRR